MLITFEGIDGSGKSTQARLLQERLRSEGRHVLLVREPGGTELSERVRSLLLDTSLLIDPLAELLLFSAARAQLVVEQIVPALERGAVVVCDRFYDSTMAYQGGARSIVEWDWLLDVQRRIVQGLVPERTYLVALSPDEALLRRQQRARQQGSPGEDRMESAGLEFQRRVAAAYDRIAAAEPGRVLRLDGRLSEQQLHVQVWEDYLALQYGGRETSPYPTGSPR